MCQREMHVHRVNIFIDGVHGYFNFLGPNRSHRRTAQCIQGSDRVAHHRKFVKSAQQRKFKHAKPKHREEVTKKLLDKLKVHTGHGL